MPGRKGEAMPQLDFSTYASQIFWLFVTFGLLYWLVAKKAIPAIGGAVEHRRARIADDLDEARRLKERAEKALADYEARLAEARTKAQATVAEHKARITAELDAERQRLEAELAEKIAQAEAETKAARDKALKEIGGVIGELAGEIVARLGGEKPDREELEAAARKAVGKEADDVSRA